MFKKSKLRTDERHICLTNINRSSSRRRLAADHLAQVQTGDTVAVKAEGESERQYPRRSRHWRSLSLNPSPASQRHRYGIGICAR
ncbi:hypothetical protein [Sphingomonas sp. CCH5-D11]|uniref:hypothetical protein n=1 Tax=Sphingomonas sp. CCH5-D11 TaxID=1768786 RepID=UPI0012E3838E|nr:hypothetical protein [Sphingomonas sp. CCH5-D11]